MCVGVCTVLRPGDEAQMAKAEAFSLSAARFLLSSPQTPPLHHPCVAGGLS